MGSGFYGFKLQLISKPGRRARLQLLIAIQNVAACARIYWSGALNDNKKQMKKRF